MNINYRIRQCREAQHMSRAALAELCDKTYQTVYSWELPPDNPRSCNPNKDTLLILASALKVSPAYLLTGIDGSVSSERFALIRRYIPELRDQEGNVIDFSSIELLGDPYDMFPYRSDWLRKMGLTAEQCRVVELEDAAMGINGQLLIDTHATDIAEGKLYVIVTPSGTRARYLHASGNGALILRADHKAAPELVAKDAIRIAGRVVAHTNFL